VGRGAFRSPERHVPATSRRGFGDLEDSLHDLVGLEQDLSDELGLRVEATTYRSLHLHLWDRVLQDEIRIP
jgi:predicted nucleotidyltransferase